MSNKTSDKNVANIEELIQEYKTYNDLDGIQDLSIYVNALENLLSEREQKDERIQELEEENKKVKAQHVFTRNKATDKEKAELYDTIDKTLDTFLEEEKPMWEQEMIADKMKLEEALNIVDAMYQDRYKKIEENNTVYVDRLKDVKFTNLEFASVILLREVQSLQRKLENSIPKQVVINTINDNGFEVYTKEYGNVEVVSIDVLQELLEGGNENG